MTDKPLKSTCHCGAITVTVPRTPEEINECQCTICGRYAAGWAYYRIKETKVEVKEGGKVSQYVWGDRTRSFNFCANCGCICYHWPFPSEDKNSDGSTGMIGVNTRNMNPMEILHVNRKIDNAMLFQPVDNPTMAHEQDQAKY